MPYIGEIRSGSTPSTDRDDYWNGDIAWVSPKDMKHFEVSSTQDCVTATAVEETRLSLIEPGSVLFVVRGMILAHSFPVAVNSKTVTINQDMKALTPANDDPRYIAHLLAGLSSPILSLLIEESAHGTRALRMERWRGFPLFLPPLEEQQEIVSYLEEEIARINALLSLVGEQAALLSERRSALRASLVVGQQTARGVLV